MPENKNGTYQITITGSKRYSLLLGKYMYSLGAGIVFLFSCFTSYYRELAYIFTIVTVLMILNRLGKGIILRELIALHSLFVCVFMPTLGYTIFTKENGMAKLWVRYMPIPEEQYFSFALPAMALFVGVLCWPITSTNASDHGEGINVLLEKASKQLLTIPKLGLYLMIVGAISLFLLPYMPVFLQFVITLVFWSSFSGVLYIYYNKEFKFKKLILLAFGAFLLMNALGSGMFTILVYMGITMFSFFFLGNKISFLKKLLVFTLVFVVIFTLQGVKGSYRNATWIQGYQGNKAVLFVDLFVKRLQNTSSFFDERSLFPIYYRTNQGFNIALVMRRFPSVEPHDNGVNLGKSFLSAFVPRLLWPDKPEAGGQFNMKHYTGININGWSTNVGPLGEAYGSFGNVGGIAFMFVLGAFIRWAYVRIFVISRKLPLMLFWIPVIFYQITYSAESDTLQIFNSLVKSAFFVWMLLKIFPKLFAKSKKLSASALPKNFQNTNLLN
ncbi:MULTISPECIES: hypothetical protein [Niastella]|uniref:Oligosaccharide repeat unit polymerase n=1 Tax=Niastella soli TaxID=2821487 RepID=A0ABS3YQG8_9BACT|nr:hypothetical protein [Niastella soli]MBO9200159.1 hypothetical protein [Niastella soli]